MNGTQESGASYDVERGELEKVDHIEGVGTPVVEVHESGTHYLELLMPNGADLLFHVFALPADGESPWAPPAGVTRLKRALEHAREHTRAPVDDQWYEAMWDVDGLPREVHALFRRVEDDVDAWLKRLGVPEEKLSGPELLKWLSPRLTKLSGRAGSNFEQRMYLYTRMLRQPLVGILREVGANIGAPSDTPGPDISYFETEIPSVGRGCWVIRMFGLAERVVDHTAVANALLSGFGS